MVLVKMQTVGLLRKNQAYRQSLTAHNSLLKRCLRRIICMTILGGTDGTQRQEILDQFLAGLIETLDCFKIIVAALVLERHDFFAHLTDHLPINIGILASQCTFCFAAYYGVRNAYRPLALLIC